MGSDIPKQYIEINGKTILEYTLQAMSAWEEMDSFVIVAASEYRHLISDIVNSTVGDKVGFLGFADPGENRELSILNAMRSAKDRLSDEAVIMIHDAVRPCVSAEVIRSLAGACLSHDGAMPYLEMKDTVYETADGTKISRNLDRSRIVAGQTPEAFKFGKYLAAVENLSREELLRVNGTTEPAVAAGLDIALVHGDEKNFKITTPADLERFKAYIG